MLGPVCQHLHDICKCVTTGQTDYDEDRVIRCKTPEQFLNERCEFSELASYTAQWQLFADLQSSVDSSETWVLLDLGQYLYWSVSQLLESSLFSKHYKMALLALVLTQSLVQLQWSAVAPLQPS